MFAHSRNVEISSETKEQIVFEAHKALRFVGGFISLLGLIILIIFLRFILPEILLENFGSSRTNGFPLPIALTPVVMFLLFLGLGFHLMSPYQLTFRQNSGFSGIELKQIGGK